MFGGVAFGLRVRFGVGMKLQVLLGVVVMSVALPVQTVFALSIGGVDLSKAAADLGVKLPDFKTASVSELSTTATKALSSLQTLAKSSPAALEQIKAVQTAVTSGDAMGALSSLASVGDLVKNIPGSDKLLTASKQVVSAWALKQGIDTSKLGGVLGALQKADVSALTSTATKLMSKGGLTDEQSGLVKGVLGTFGVATAK